MYSQYKKRYTLDTKQFNRPIVTETNKNRTLIENYAFFLFMFKNKKALGGHLHRNILQYAESFKQTLNFDIILHQDIKREIVQQNSLGITKA